MYKAIFPSKTRLCDSTNNNLISSVTLCTHQPIFFTLLQVINHYLENCRSCRYQNLLCHVYKTNFLCTRKSRKSRKSKVCNLPIIIQSEFCDFYAYAQSILFNTMYDDGSTHYLENCRRQRHKQMPRPFLKV